MAEGTKKELKNYHTNRNLKKLFRNAETADVIFRFPGEDGAKSLSAHKCLLAIASPVFQKMFYGPLKENSDVQIVDSSSDAFCEFLQFFYLDEVVFSTGNIADVMKMADKYDVAGCMNLCSMFLEWSLTADTACWCYELALLFEQPHLIRMCEERIFLIYGCYGLGYGGV